MPRLREIVPCLDLVVLTLWYLMSFDCDQIELVRAIVILQMVVMVGILVQSGLLRYRDFLKYRGFQIR